MQFKRGLWLVNRITVLPKMSMSKFLEPMNVNSPNKGRLLIVLCCVGSFSRVPLFVTPWTVACQAPLSMRFPKQEYWSGLPFPSPGHLPNPGIKLESPMLPALTGAFFTAWPPGKPLS